MKPPSFEFHQPGTLDGALDVLAEHGDDAKVLAGGQSLIPLLNFRLARPHHIVDLGRMPGLSFVRRSQGRLLIGARTTQTQLEHSRIAGKGWPLLVEAVSAVAHPQIRNVGTIGGSVAHGDPSAELPCALLCLGAKFHVRSSERSRILEASDLFQSYFTTALTSAEILTAIEVPPLLPHIGHGFWECTRRHGDFALVGAAATVTVNSDGACTACSVCLLGAGSVPLRARCVEAEVLGGRLDVERIIAASHAVEDDVVFVGDMHASASYRARLMRTAVHRALHRAMGHAKQSW